MTDNFRPEATAWQLGKLSAQTVIGNVKTMTYDNIMRGEQKRAAKVGTAGTKRDGLRPNM